MYSARYPDYLVSLIGACLIAFGLGLLLAEQLASAAWLLIAGGAVAHGWGMYRAHRSG